MSPRDRINNILGCFICAGVSALLLSFAHLSEELWYLSLFALVPFLWRSVRVSLSYAILTGFMFAASYLVASAPDFSGGAISNILRQFITLSLVLGTYGAVVNKTSKFLGLNAALLAVLWLPLEYLLTNYSGIPNLFTISSGQASVIFGFGSLLGMLTLSVLFVLVNSLFLMVIGCLVDSTRRKTEYSKNDTVEIIHKSVSFIFQKSRFTVPSLRAPPRLSLASADK